MTRKQALYASIFILIFVIFNWLLPTLNLHRTNSSSIDINFQTKLQAEITLFIIPGLFITYFGIERIQKKERTVISRTFISIVSISVVGWFILVYIAGNLLYGSIFLSFGVLLSMISLPLSFYLRKK